MGRVISLRPEDNPIKDRLIDFAAGDEALIKLINHMTVKQLTSAEGHLAGSLCDFVDKLEALRKEFADYVSSIQAREGNMLIINAIIDYVVGVCEAFPKKNEADDPIDTAYQALLGTEMHRYVEKALKEVQSDGK